MYITNMNKDIPIEYDPNIISKIKEIIKEGVEKLKTFILSKMSLILIFIMI